MCMPPANNVFNPVAAFQGVGVGGLLGLDFATRLNSTVGWPMMTGNFPQQQQHSLHQPPQAIVSQAHQGQPTLAPSPLARPQQQPILAPVSVPLLGASGMGIMPQPQPLAFLSQPQRYVSPVTMGLGGVGMPLPDLGTASAAAKGASSTRRVSVGFPIPEVAPRVPIVAARTVGAKLHLVEGAKKRRRKEDSDVGRKFKEQIVRRRERNRVLAKQTRMRKKFFYQSLQKRLLTLHSDNKMLKAALTERLGERAKQVVHDCTSELSRQIVARGIIETDEDADREDVGGFGSGGTGSGGTSTRALAKPDFNLMKSLQLAQQIFVVTEPSLPDNPIVFASDGFLKFTGYTKEQVLGRNCRFLQGPDTDKRSVAIIRRAIKNGEDAHVSFLNYKADGTPFWNQFFIAALRDEKNRIMNYVGAQCPIPGPIPPFDRKPLERPVKSMDGGEEGDGRDVGGDCVLSSWAEDDSQDNGASKILSSIANGEESIVGEASGRCVSDECGRGGGSSVGDGGKSHAWDLDAYAPDDGENTRWRSGETRAQEAGTATALTAAAAVAAAAEKMLHRALQPDAEPTMERAMATGRAGVQVAEVTQQ